MLRFIQEPLVALITHDVFDRFLEVFRCQVRKVNPARSDIFTIFVTNQWANEIIGKAVLIQRKHACAKGDIGGAGIETFPVYVFLIFAAPVREGQDEN